MKSIKTRFLFFIIIITFSFGFSLVNIIDLQPSRSNSPSMINTDDDVEYQFLPKLSQPDGEYSNFNLSLKLGENTSSVEGNVTVDFYNNDPHNFTQIPFHLYLYGMEYQSRPGTVEIINITSFDNPKIALDYEILADQELMWVNLTETLEAYERTKMIITFNATVPNGDLDRANSMGNDGDQSRIYTFACFYPVPCVYDAKDGWNIDPYYSTGEPFYYDMAYYNLILNVPKEMIIAATGKQVSKIITATRTIYQFDPIYPVRNIVFSASRYFIVESQMRDGVNVSTFYIPKSEYLWEDFALNKVLKSLSLYNETFGTYPYPTMNVIETYAWYGGMEYPCQVFISEQYDDIYLPVRRWYFEKVIIHEVAHEWWYNLIGNDEVDFGVIDEGLACWTHDYYGEVFYGDWDYFKDHDFLDETRTFYITNGRTCRVNKSTYQYAISDDYYYACYSKAPLLFDFLRHYIGDTDYLLGLKYFFAEYRFKHAVLYDLLNAFEYVTDYELDWFFLPMFDNSYLPKYSYKNYTFNQNTKVLEVSIEDLNQPLNKYSYSQLVPIKIYDGSNNIILDDKFWINGTTTLTIPLTTNPKKVSLEYKKYLLVQFQTFSDESLDLYIDIEQSPPLIPGYNLLLLIIAIFMMIGIVIIKKKK